MSTTLNLKPFTSIEHAWFVKLTIQENGAPVVIRMSTYRTPINITETDGIAYSYNALGAVLGVSDLIADSKSTLNDVTLTLGGIPNTYIADILNTQIKSSPVEIRRAYFDAKTGQLLSIAGNPSITFNGYVTNYTFDEAWSDGSNQSITTSVALVCSSLVSVLQNKIAGRRTNVSDQTYWFPGDNSMNRVGIITNQYLDFGGSTPVAPAVATPGASVKV